jgi:hypothetical protein
MLPKGAPLVYTNRIPWKMRAVPKVTMNGGAFLRVVINPFRNPARAPMARQKRAIGMTIEFLPAIKAAAKTQLVAMTEAMERSIPPERITSVCPTLTTPKAEAC